MSSSVLTIQLYLKHFRPEVIDYILAQTGYMNLIQYEMECRSTDVFNVNITPNGYISSVPPIVNEETTAVFELSLHHLRDEIIETLTRSYLGLPLTEYELSYSTYNNLYVTVPYRVNEFWEGDQGLEDGYEYEEDEEESEDEDEYEEEESEDDESEDEEEESEDETNDWSYTLNTKTNNSYILKSDTHPTTEVVILATDDGSSKTCYYNAKYGGWIVSLQCKNALDALVGGDEESDVEEDDVVTGNWSYTLNTKTNNSYILKSDVFPTTEVVVLPAKDGTTKKCYYNEKYGGWIVSLQCKSALDNLVGGDNEAVPVNDVEQTIEIAESDSLTENQPFLGWYFEEVCEEHKNTKHYFYKLAPKSNRFDLKYHRGVSWIIHDSGITPGEWDIEGIDRILRFDRFVGGWVVPTCYANELVRGGATMM